MKKIYILSVLLTAFAIQLKAQTTYFTQNFQSSTTYTDYVNSTPTANLFDYSLVNGGTTASAAGNLLNLTKPSGSTGGVSFTRVAATMPTALPATTSVLQMTFNINSNAITGSTNTTLLGGFIMLGQPDASDGASIAPVSDAKSTMKLRVEYDNVTGSATFGKLRISNYIASTTIKATPYFTGPMRIDVVINTTNNTVNYAAPTTVASTGTLAPGTVDLYFGGTLAPQINDAALLSPTLIPTGFRISLSSFIQSIDIDDIVIKDASTVTVLPVDLLSFTGKAESNGVALNWATASEQNSDYFEISKYDATTKTYSSLAKVNAAGNSVEKRNYQYIDNQPDAGANYYQLKQVDKDGTSKTYPVTAVNYELNSFEFNVFKSEENNYKYGVFSNEQKIVELSLISLDGRVLSQKTVQLSSGYNTGTLATTPFNSGLYLVRLKDAKGQVFVKKLMISAN